MQRRCYFWINMLVEYNMSAYLNCNVQITISSDSPFSSLTRIKVLKVVRSAKHDTLHKNDACPGKEMKETACF